MKYFLAVTLGFVILNCIINEVEGVIVSPCKVRNLVTQPEHATSLKTKGLVNIIQIPPVFVQNVMVGICENHNQNVSTGKVGEFYACQQRWSAVEVYVAENSNPRPPTDPYHSQPNSELKFVRESVIIESGCDFTFNLLPLIMSAHQAPPERQTNYQTPQHKMFLRSPYHQQLRQPPGASVPVPAPPPPQGIPADSYAMNHPTSSASGAPGTYATHSQGRASTSEVDVESQDIAGTVETKDSQSHISVDI